MCCESITRPILYVLAVAVACATALGCGEQGEPDEPVVRGDWTVQGVYRGTVTLTEAESGTSWTFEGDGDPLPDEIPIEFPDTGTWSFEIEVDSPDPLVCETTIPAPPDPAAGRGKGAYANPRIYCGFAWEDLTIPDSGLASCIYDALDSISVDTPTTRHIGSLWCPRRGIENLFGLELFYKLRYLRLEENALTSVDTLDLTRLPRLLTLELAENEIETVDLSFVVGTFFGELDLSENRITEVSGLDGVNLDKLDLDGNLLERFEVTGSPTAPPIADPADLSAEIERLELADNQLEHVDLSGFSTGPRYLDLSENQLDRLNLDLGEEWAATLFDINLGSNLFSEALDPDDSSVRSLRIPRAGVTTLRLYGNLFTDVPSEYIGPDLVYLNVSNNAIESIDLRDAPDLKHLDIDRNALTSLSLAGADSLESLDAQDNAIAYFDWQLGVNELYDLDLSGNPLGPLTSCQSPTLDALSLDDGGLTQIDLSGCPRLRVALLRDNQLSTLDVSSNPALDSLYLNDNPMSCDAIDAIRAADPYLYLSTGPDPCVP